MINTIIIDGKVYHSEETKNFNKLILKHLDDDDIRDYAEDVLDLVEEEECECEDADLNDFQTEDIIWELEQRGLIVFRTQSIIDSMRIEKMRDALNY